MIQGFIDGIKNMIGNIGNAVKGIADKVKSFLHFSRPDEGPLRDYEKWMPDMIQGLSKTLNASAPKLYKASKELANKIANGLDMSSILNDASYTMNTNFVPIMQELPDYATKVQPKNIMGETLTHILSNNQNGANITIPLTLNIGNKRIGEILLEDLRSITRQTGKNIEALVN